MQQTQKAQHGRRWSAGWGWASGVLVGQRYGSGSSKSPARFYCESVRAAEGGPLLLRQVVNAGGMRPAHFLICDPTASPRSRLLLCHFTQLEGTLASFCRSLSFCWREPQNDSAYRFQRGAQERAAFRKLNYSAVRGSLLTRLLALIFLVSTLFSAVIFLMFS